MADTEFDPGTLGAGPPPEKARLTLGMVALTDCAPLVIAKEKGWFEACGLEVTLSRHASWASIRDLVAIGALDGAQMLAGMPLALTLGLEAMEVPTLTAFTLGLGGNAITVSQPLYRRLVEADPEAMAQQPVTAAALKAVIEAGGASGRRLVFAMVYPFSDHNYELRYWLAAAGIDPDRDLDLTVVPPPQMVAALAEGVIDGCCVGEPWNGRAVRAGIGCTLIATTDLWNNHPGKVLGVTRAWAERHPHAHRALIRALTAACHWLDRPENRLEAARLVSAAGYVDVPFEIAAMSLSGLQQFLPQAAPRFLPDFHVFYRYAANFPWRSHALWLLAQMVRWGQIRRPVDLHAVAAAVYRPDLYRSAVSDLGLAVPTGDYKSEGAHSSPWTWPGATGPLELGPDRFFDGSRFDPGAPLGWPSE